MHRRALVVDAERGVRTLVGAVLRRDGFDVELARDLTEGRRSGSDRFDLLVTTFDLDQPQGGVALARVLRGHLPDIQIIYLTRRESVDPPLDLDARSTVLTKPFTIAQLRGAVGAVFRESGYVPRGHDWS